MTQGNGNGSEKGANIGLRPALAEIMDRQEAVLHKLLDPIPARQVATWKADAVRAAVGRVSPGMRALLADPEIAVLTNTYLTGAEEASRSFRTILHEHLSVEYARALQDMSVLSLEEMRRQGVASAEMTRAYSTTQFR